MVTNETEGGKLKCHRYWPDPTSTPPSTKQTYGSIEVEFLGVVHHKYYAVREFNVKFEGQTRHITHFYYLSWPDHGVPLTTNEFLVFRNVVKSAVTQPTVPILIHCSAGVGRTGTYIGIDQLLEQCMNLGGVPDVDTIVRKMRIGRNHMVQTEQQYVFIYRAVLDALTDLLQDESGKSARISAQLEAEKEYQKQLEAAAEAAAAEKRQEEAREKAQIEAARLELLGRNASSALDAATLVRGNGIKDRIKAIKESEKNRYEQYKKSLEEWQERNKVCCAYVLVLTLNLSQLEQDNYDLTSTLSPVQSRIEALRQKGLLA
jgi:protein-tyrosine phosphatase